MKNIKKAIVALLAVCLLMSLAPMAMADDPAVADRAALEAAISAAAEGGTVKLTGPIDLGTSGIKVSKKVTIDLGGFALTSTDSVYATICVGTAGDVTIVDSSDAKGGKVINTNGNALGNFGKVTVEGGTFEGWYAFYNFNNTVSPVAMLNGGTFVAAGSDDISIANCGELFVGAGAVIKDTLDSSAKLVTEGGSIENLVISTPDYAPACGTSAAIGEATVVETLTSDVVASVDGVGYLTLAEAVEKAADGKTVKLEKGIDLGANGIIVSKKVTIDLGGFALTSADSVYATICVGTAGDVTIVDSSDAKSGKVINTNGNALGNFGKVTVEGGTFEGWYAFYNFNNTVSPVAVLDGGVFVATGSDNIAIANCGEMTVNSAKVEGILDSSAKIEILGGEFQQVDITAADYSPACGTSAVIKGGSYVVAPDVQYIADGFELTGNGPFGVVEETPDAPVVTPVTPADPTPSTGRQNPSTGIGFWQWLVGLFA